MSRKLVGGKLLSLRTAATEVAPGRGPYIANC